MRASTRRSAPSARRGRLSGASSTRQNPIQSTRTPTIWPPSRRLTGPAEISSSSRSPITSCPRKTSSSTTANVARCCYSRRLCTRSRWSSTDGFWRFEPSASPRLRTCSRRRRESRRSPCGSTTPTSPRDSKRCPSSPSPSAPRHSRTSTPRSSGRPRPMRSSRLTTRSRRLRRRRRAGVATLAGSAVAARRRTRRRRRRATRASQRARTTPTMSTPWRPRPRLRLTRASRSPRRRRLRPSRRLRTRLFTPG